MVELPGVSRRPGLATVERTVRESLVIALKELRCAGQGRLEPEAQPLWIEVEP